MRHLLVVALAALTLGACSKSDAPKSSPPPPPPTTGSSAPAAAPGSAAPGSAAPSSGSADGSGSAGSAAPITIKPYTPAADVPAPIRAAIAATDRTDADRALDAGRKPGEVLAFFQIAPGQHVGELFSGGGYTTEILARVVGDKGAVFAQNTKEVLDKFARKPLTARLAKPVNKQVVLVERPAEDPFPPEAKNLDAVLCILNYHDFVWQKVDRTKLNAAVFAALKPGGIYGIVDHAAAAKSGTRDAETLHRIDREVVVQEVTAAGFKLDKSSDVLANPSDTHDWNSSPKAAGDRRGTSDRFTLRFVKPKK